MRVLFFLSCFFLCLLRGVCGSGFFDEDAAESALISETTLAVSPMFASAPVRSALVGGYFSAALFHNGTIAIQGMGQTRTLEGVWSGAAAGTYELLALDSEHRLHSLNLRDQPDHQLSPVVASGDGHVAAFCSGFEGFRVVLSSAPSALVCGSNFALALYDDGRVMGLGSDSWGALAGTGSSENSWTELLRGASSVAAGGDHALAVVDGKVLSWGWAEMGQLGRPCNGTFCPVPAEVVGLPGRAKSVFAGGYGHSGAIMENGKVYGWGWSRHGQLGEPTSHVHFLPPIQLDFQNVASVCSGSFKHTVFVTHQGTVFGVGSNAFRQIKSSM